MKLAPVAGSVRTFCKSTIYKQLHEIDQAQKISRAKNACAYQK